MRFVVVFCALLMGCNSAGPAFRGLEPVARAHGGDQFLIRQSGPLAEVIRTNPLAFPTFPPVANNAARALMASTGCPPIWVEGDPSMMTIGLDCPGLDPPARPRSAKGLVCRVYNTRYRDATGMVDGFLDCGPA